MESLICIEAEQCNYTKIQLLPGTLRSGVDVFLFVYNNLV